MSRQPIKIRPPHGCAKRSEGSFTTSAAGKCLHQCMVIGAIAACFGLWLCRAVDASDRLADTIACNSLVFHTFVELSMSFDQSPRGTSTDHRPRSSHSQHN